MAVGFPAKTTFTNGTILPASDLNDLAGTINLLYAAGRAQHTTGAQSIAAYAAVALVSNFLQGGITFDSQNGGGLKVAATGLYQVNATGNFVSGTGWRGVLDVRRWRSGAATIVATASCYVGSVDNYYPAVSTLVQLQAGDILTLAALGAGTVTDGTSLSLVRVG